MEYKVRSRELHTLIVEGRNKCWESGVEVYLLDGLYLRIYYFNVSETVGDTKYDKYSGTKTMEDCQVLYLEIDILF